MAAQPTTPKPELHVPVHPVRIVTASSLFDGHDASINIMRRIMQSQGAEVIHLGHNRSVREVVDAAIEEDVQGVAVSSYQGGHVEYFEYLVRAAARGGRRPRQGRRRWRRGHRPGRGRAAARRRGHDLQPRGRPAARPARHGQPGRPRLRHRPVGGAARRRPRPCSPATGPRSRGPSPPPRPATSTDELRAELERAASARRVPVLGITGTGGSGKSSLTDELVRRLRVDQQDKLRDRLRRDRPDPPPGRGRAARRPDPDERARRRPRLLPLARHPRQPRGARGARRRARPSSRRPGSTSSSSRRPGIGQGDAAITSFADVNLYVMTPEFGAASQLEKIDMLDFADVVAINKFERRGAMDALRDVGRQMVRNREAFGKKPEDMPVFGTSAATFNDDGVTALYQELRGLLGEAGLEVGEGALAPVVGAALVGAAPGRAAAARALPRRDRRDRARLPRGHPAVRRRRPSRAAAHRGRRRAGAGRRPTGPVSTTSSRTRRTTCRCRWPASSPGGPRSSRPTRATSRSSRSATRRSTPRWCGSRCPATGSVGSRCRATPTTATSCRSCGGRTSPATSRSPPACSRSSGTTRTPPGCSPARATRSAPTAASRCSREGQPATRLSTAFDSVTLYGRDPDKRPDIYGKVGTSGVSVATLDDMRELYAGFDLTSPDDERVDDDQRPRADDPRVLPQHGHGPRGRVVGGRAGTRAERGGGGRHPGDRPCRSCAAPCRPTSSRRTRARTPACSPPSSACG